MTPTNESPAPQAPQFLPCEDGEFNGPAFAGECCSAISPCAHQRKSPDTICETCRLATARPAPQPPVEGLREALEHARVRFECLADDFEKAGRTVDWAMCSVDAERMNAALASPSLTAGPVATKKTYIKPLRTIVEIDERYADKIRDLLNAPATLIEQSDSEKT